MWCEATFFFFFFFIATEMQQEKSRSDDQLCLQSKPAFYQLNQNIILSPKGIWGQSKSSVQAYLAFCSSGSASSQI